MGLLYDTAKCRTQGLQLEVLADVDYFHEIGEAFAASLDVGGLAMGVEVGFGIPLFDEGDVIGVGGIFVEVVEDAAFFGEGGGDEAQEEFAGFVPFAGLGFKVCDAADHALKI